MTIRSWLLASRPKTLTAALIPVAVATALAHRDGYEVQWWISLCALLSAMLIQVATNLINDALDFRKGADTDQRLGPQRVTQSGLIHERWVMRAGFASLAGAALLGIPLLVQGGLPILLIGIFSLLMGYAYTGGPYPLAYKGLGEVFVVLFFGVIAVGGVYLLQTGWWSEAALLIGLQVGLLSTVLLAVNNLRDHEGDVLVSKKTLAVRFGVRFARYEIALCALMPFVLNLYWMQDSAYLTWLPWLTLPAALVLVRGVFKNPPGLIYNRYLGFAALLHLSFGLALCLGLW